MKVVHLLLLLSKGDNFVISQQTARACLKYLASPVDLPPSAEYLGKSRKSDFDIPSAASWRDPQIQSAILERRSRNAIARLGALIQQGNEWNTLNMECVSVSRAHVEVSILDSFIKCISSTADTSLRSSLTKLCNLVCNLNILLISTHCMFSTKLSQNS
jgi:hypothetical protein